MKKIFIIGSAIVILFLAGSLYVRSKAPASLFVPAQRERSKQVVLPDTYHTDFVKNKAGQNVEIVTAPNVTSRYAILYFHGNGGRIPDIMAQANKVATVVSPSYPGYSKSEGEPTEANVYETADLAMQYLADHGYDQPRIIVLGHSLGGTAAVYIGAHYPSIKQLILVNTLDSVFSLCWPKYYILCSLTRNYFNSDRLARQVIPFTRVFHDQGDTVIPYSQGQKLFQAIKSADKKFETLAGTHSTFDVATVLATVQKD